MSAAARAAAELAARIGETAAALARIDPEDIRIGTTPKDEVFRAGKARLCRYRSEGPRPLGPVLIVYGLVGRYTMADIEPERSLVRRLLDAGADVWLIDWADAGPEDRGRDFDHYLADLDACVDHVGRPALLGICEGGVFSLIHAALHPAKARALTLAITPVDFHADQGEGVLNAWARAFSPEDVDRLIEAHGALPGQLMGLAFQAISPAKTLAKYQFGLLDVADDPAALRTWLRMEKWLTDRPDHPGAAARRWLVELYGENRLAQGRLEIGGRRVDLAAIAAPVLNVYGLRDTIIPPACSQALGALVSAPYEEIAAPAGHVGVIVSARCQRIVAGGIAAWLGRIPR